MASPLFTSTEFPLPSSKVITGVDAVISCKPFSVILNLTTSILLDKPLS